MVQNGFASKVGITLGSGSVQGAVATWANYGNKILRNIAC